MSKVVLITGGSSGIGKAIGTYLTEKECIVYGTSRNPERMTNFDVFDLIAMDVTNEESILQGINEVISKEGKIDILINNAGIGITGPVEEIPKEEIHKAFETNLYGPISVIQQVLPHMRKQNKGLIINITSIAGYMGLPYRGIYSATKSALEVITEAMRMEIASFGIEMTNVAPGDFVTNIASSRYHSPTQNGSPYKAPYRSILQMMDDQVKEGGDPKDIAKLIYKIINVKNPKIHYKTGAFMQKFSIVLKRVLPDKTYERLLRNHYKL